MKYSVLALTGTANVAGYGLIWTQDKTFTRRQSKKKKKKTSASSPRFLLSTFLRCENEFSPDKGVGRSESLFLERNARAATKDDARE